MLPILVSRSEGRPMTMRRVLATTGLAALLAVGVGTGWAQERSTERFSSQYRRVPPFFGQVGLTPDQRERIYTIRGEYDQKIAELTRQLEALKAGEIADCEGVLTPAQKQLLVQIRAARGYRAPAATAPTLDNVEVGVNPPTASDAKSADAEAKPAEEKGGSERR